MVLLLIGNMLGSTAIVGFITGAAGTVFGAWLTSRAAHKLRTVDELKAVRAAYALSQTIANSALAIKAQHIKPMKDRFDRAEIEFMIARWRRTPLDLTLDLNTLSTINFPTDRLMSTVFEKCLVNMKCMSLSVQMHSSAEEFRASIAARNELVESFQKNKPASHAERIQFYFGYPGEGFIDQRFRNNLDALSHQVDDCIMFSMMLCEELLKRYNAVHGRYKYKFRLGLNKMIPGDWSAPRTKGLMPPRELWADWDEKFVYPPSRWQRFQRAFKSGRWADWKEVY
jgi:hypothetical protein